MAAQRWNTSDEYARLMNALPLAGILPEPDFSSVEVRVSAWVSQDYALAAMVRDATGTTTRYNQRLGRPVLGGGAPVIRPGGA